MQSLLLRISYVIIWLMILNITASDQFLPVKLQLNLVECMLGSGIKCITTVTGLQWVLQLLCLCYSNLWEHVTA